jgi:hypothetical protein
MRKIGDTMKDDTIDLEQYLQSFENPDQVKLHIYEALLALLVRKYIPGNKKIELNLNHSYRDTLLDVTINSDGIAKISWGEN